MLSFAAELEEAVARTTRTRGSSQRRTSLRAAEALEVQARAVVEGEQTALPSSHAAPATALAAEAIMRKPLLPRLLSDNGFAPHYRPRDSARRPNVARAHVTAHDIQLRYFATCSDMVL
jgi:hypothetical protein